ncbi:flagellar motor protein PomA [Zobellella iuensis]|uniref:Flagellar motor protein PomA n=1 Tax=Zobellella iuensis TaxID=2803811 RepID=A0ABS1QV97_9GAMM|nr:flagellar motor protein PomA [Zobellella iuensis]MBL1378791.1 flagellar motor protein PomA [Zobellella iuensis]
MDLATLIGLIGAMAFIAMAMVLGGGMTMYVDVPSIFIVLVGSLFVVMMKFNLGQFLGAAKVAAKAFMFKLEKPEDLIERVVQLADSARKGGFLALEEANITNPFLQKAVDMLVDGHEQNVVKAALEKDIDLTAERQTEGARIFRSLGDVAPAMGMIGTLIGLVAMLANMDDPKAIGPAMAIALLTTLYGAMLANMVALPIADKLELRSGEERLNRTLILDAILGIQDGQNPRVLQSLLENYLADSKRPREE